MDIFGILVEMRPCSWKVDLGDLMVPQLHLERAQDRYCLTLWEEGAGCLGRFPHDHQARHCCPEDGDGDSGDQDYLLLVVKSCLAHHTERARWPLSPLASPWMLLSEHDCCHGLLQKASPN